MNTAETVKEACKGASAYTLEGGYAVGYNSEKTYFEPAKISETRWNQSKTRVTHCVATFKDGSQLTFTWSQSFGSKLQLRQSRIPA